MEDKEIEFIDYLRIFWKRKWIIIFGTILSIVIAGIISFLLKPVYEIDTIIQPGKFFIQNQSGNFDQVIVEEPNQIANKVRHKSYDAQIASMLRINGDKFPRIMAENIRDTILTRIWIKDPDVNMSKKVLDSLILLVKESIDEKIDIEIKNIDTSIKSNEIEKGRRMKQIDILNKKLKIIDQRKNDILKEMQSIKERIKEIEKEQLSVLKKENRSEIESLGLLLYSNEIQQSLEYYDILNEKLSDERIEEEDVQSEIQIEKAEIGKIDEWISNLKEKKGRIDYTKIVKAPTSSSSPVSPNKGLNILIAAILSFVVFSVLVFIIEYIDRSKAEDLKK